MVINENEPQNEMEKAFLTRFHNHLISAEVFAGLDIKDGLGVDALKPVENMALMDFRRTFEEYKVKNRK